MRAIRHFLKSFESSIIKGFYAVLFILFIYFMALMAGFLHLLTHY